MFLVFCIWHLIFAYKSSPVWACVDGWHRRREQWSKQTAPVQSPWCCMITRWATLKMMTVMKVMVNKISDCVDAGVGSKRRELNISIFLRRKCIPWFVWLTAQFETQRSDSHHDHHNDDEIHVVVMIKGVCNIFKKLKTNCMVTILWSQNDLCLVITTLIIKYLW